MQRCSVFCPKRKMNLETEAWPLSPRAISFRCLTLLTPWVWIIKAGRSWLPDSCLVRWTLRSILKQESWEAGMRNRYEQEAEELIYLCLKHNLVMTLFTDVQLSYFDYGSSVKTTRVRTSCRQFEVNFFFPFLITEAGYIWLVMSHQRWEGMKQVPEFSVVFELILAVFDNK